MNTIVSSAVTSQILRMRKRKDTTTWMAYRIGGAKAERLGEVEDTTEQEALEDAYRIFEITSASEKKRVILRSY